MIFNNLSQVVDFESDIVDMIRERMGDKSEERPEVQEYYTMDFLPFPCHVIFHFDVEWPKITVRHEYRKVWIHGENDGEDDFWVAANKYDEEVEKNYELQKTINNLKKLLGMEA